MAETYYVKPENSPVNDVTLNAGDAMFITNGGTANGAVVNSDGAATVNDGGSANNTTVNEGGTLHLIGGAATGVNVASNGRLEVNKGATATGIEAEKGATLVFDVAADTHIAGTSDGAAFQIQNGVATGFTLETGVLIVSDGGKAVETALNSAGFINVSQGGSADKAVINTSGELMVSSGGTATEATVKTGGKLTVESSGFCDDATVEMGGNLYVISSGGTAAGTYIGAMGNLAVSKGGTAYGTTVGAGGFLTVGTKGIAEGADVNGFLNVLEGGLASNVTVNEGAVVYIQSKGTGSDVYVDDGGILEAMADGRLKGATVAQGGSATIHADVMASNVVIDGGKVTVMSDGWAYQSGVSSNTIVRNGGRLVVSGGGFVVGAAVSAGGHVTVESDATFSSATVADADVTALDGACVSRLNLEAGGILNVVSGGKAEHINVSAGGVLTGILREASELKFYGGTVDLDISTAAPGNEFLIDDYSFSNFVTTEVYTYLCTLTVSDTQAEGAYKLIEGATGFDKTITVKDTLGATLGTLTVAGGTTDIGGVKYTLAVTTEDVLTVTIGEPGENIISGDIADDTKDVPAGWSAVNVNVNANGGLNVLDGGKASSTTVNDGGKMYVSSGGVASSTTVNSNGYLFLMKGGVASDTTVNKGGQISVASTGVASNTTVSSGGSLGVGTGGSATNITAIDGAHISFNIAPLTYAQGTLNGSAFEFKDGTVAGYTVRKGMTLDLISGGSTSDIRVSSGGSMILWGGGVAKDTVVEVDGLLRIRKAGGVASDVRIEAGGRLEMMEGKLTGQMMFDDYAKVTVSKSDAIVDFDISLLAPSNVMLVNNLSVISGTPSYTLTIEGTEVDGTYNLAGGAAGFDQTITVKNLLGTELGTLTVGATTDIVGVKYTLTLTGSNLSVTVGDTIVIDTTPPTVTNITPSTTEPAASVTITADFADETALAYSLCKIGDGTWQDYPTGGVTVTENTTVYFKAIDAAGNVSEEKNYVVTNIIGGGVDLTGDLSTSFELTAGMVGSSVNILDGGILDVMNDGFTSQTTIQSNGDLFVSGGGSADVVTVNFGGDLFVRNGGVATLVMENGGYASVNDGATVTFVPNSFNGYVYDKTDDWATLHSGTTGTDLTVGNAARILVFSSGLAKNTTVNAAGALVVSSGGKADGMNVKDGGTLFVSDGGKATGKMTFETGATVNASAGAIVDFDLTKTTAGDPALVNDLSFFGTAAVNYTLTVDGTEAEGDYKLAEGATGFDKTITVMNTSGVELGTLTVGTTATLADGRDYTLTLNSGILGLTVAGGGGTPDLTGDLSTPFNLNAGMVGSSVNILEGGRLKVLNGGFASQTTVKTGGSMTVSAGGSADIVTVSGGGEFYVRSGGTATNIAWTPCEGLVYVGNGASATFVSTYTGVYYGSDGKMLENAAVMDGKILDENCEMWVMDGGLATNTTLDGCMQVFVRSGGAASGATIVNYGWIAVSSGGVADDITIVSGALGVQNGGSANAAKVGADGRLEVFSGGTATNIAWTPCEGEIYIENGGYATYANTYTGVYYGSDNKLLESAASMDGKTLDDNCIMYVMDGGLVTNTTVDGHGDVEIWSGGKAANATLNYGWLSVSSGGVAAGITVNGTGSVKVSGGVIDGAVFKTGCELVVYDEAKFTGRITFENGIFVENYGDLILDFDLTQTAPDAAALVNDLSILMGTPGYTLTVGGSEVSGTYNLADGATGFDKTITVMSPLGEEYGTLTVGGSLSTAFADYTLNLSGAALTLDLVAKVVVDTTPPEKPIPDASSKEPTNGYVIVTATFSDDSVLRECSKDGENWVEYQSSGLTFVENGKAYFRATDGAGNVSDIAVYEVTNIDKVAPTISYITPSTTAPTASVTVTASFDDDVSLASTQYRIGDSAWQDYTTGVTVTENTTVYFKAVDAAGNETTDSYEVTNITGGGSVDLTGDLDHSYVLTAGKVASSVNILSGAGLDVKNGAFASQTTIQSNGNLFVSAGGSADVVTVNFGGYMEVNDGGTATKITENGGYVDVNDGATVEFLPNSFGGYSYNNAIDWCTLHSGTTGTNLSASNGGAILIFDGGKAINTTIGSLGELHVSSGGKVTGKMTFETGADVAAETGAVLDFDLTQTTAGAEALVNDLSFALAQPFGYTLTVDGTQASGTYNLGGNATGFNKIISVRNTSGVDYGYLTFGGTLSTAFANFTLNLTSDDTLTVNVAAKGGSDTTPPVITITPSTTELAKSVTMTAEFTDNVAVATRQYRIGDGAWLNYEAPFTVTENAVIGFRATDTSGNTTVESYEVQNIQPDAKNEPDNGWNDYLYDKKKGWNKDENISQFASNVITGNGEIHLDPAGLIDLEGMHNMFGNDGTNVDTGDVGKISVTTAAKVSFSVLSTADGTFFIYQDGFDKKGNRAQLTVGKVTVKKNKVATLSGICLTTDGLYYAAMTAKNVKKPGPSAIYNVTVVDSTIFVDADDGWNNAALNKTVVDNPFKIERDVKTVKLDNVDMIDGGDFNNFVGFTDPVDYAKLDLASTAYLSFNIGTNGSAKFTLWKRDTGTGKLAKVGGVTSLKSKKGELVTKTTKAQLLEVGDKYDYFVSMECTDAAKGGSAYYNVNVNTVATRFFDSNDAGENNWLFDKKNKAYNDDANLRSNTLPAFGDKTLYLDNTASGDPAFNNFVGFKDSADYAKVVLTKGGSLRFKITALADVSFEIWRKGEDKKGAPALYSLQKKTDVKVKDYAVGATETTDALTLEAGEYYISVTAKSTKANEKGSAFYNVTAMFGSADADALLTATRYEGPDAIAMTDGLSFGQSDADVLADASAVSGLDALNGGSAWQDLVTLA